MSLSTDLIDQFVQATNDEKKEASDGIAYGTVVKDGDATYVQLDGSTYSTPVTSTTNVKHGERVAVLIKNHTATITGNFSSPADSTSSLMNSINSFDMAVGKKLSTEELTANSAFIKFLLSDEIVAEDIIAANAKIDALEVDKLTVEDLKAVYGNFEALDAYFAQLGVATIDKATIKELNATSGHFRDLHVDYGEFERITATKGTFEDVVADTIEAQIINGTALDVKYANVEFANITEAAIKKLFAGTGLIDKLTVSDGMKVTGELAAVTINADNIKTGTMTADRLLLKGENGLYYQLNYSTLGEDFFATDLTEEEQQELQNGIHGENIIAHSITAKHIVADDLTAFGATIANFHIVPADADAGATGKLYSDVKEDVNNTTRGIYMDTTGQFAVGDINNFLKFYKDTDEKYKLAINASQIILGSSGKNVEDALDEAAGGIELITKQYYLSTSKDVPTNDAIRRNYNITVIQNDDGTNTLSITDAVDDGGDYDIVVTENADGTQTLSITDAVGDGGDYDIAVIQNDDGTKTLLVTDDVGWSEIPPTWQTGMYMWTRDKIVYKNPTRIEYTTPVLDSAWEAVNELEADSKEYAYDKVSEVNDKLNSDKLVLEDMINKNALDVVALNDLVQRINGKLQRIVTDEDEANTTMFEQNGESYIFNFFEKQQTQANAIEAYQGSVVIEKDDNGDPNVKIQAASTSKLKLRLSNDEMTFVDASDNEIGTISADNEGRLGIAVDNETVTGEFRQSNQNEEHGEFVWQVRRNGNYGLSWKGSVKT